MYIMQCSRYKNMTLLVFLGNEIAGEDALGYIVYEKIKDKIKGRCEYLGTDLSKLYGIYRNEEKLIIIDAIYGIDDVIHIKNDEIWKIDDASSGAHGLAAIEILKILKIVMEKFPSEIHLIGLPAKNFETIEENEEVIEKAIKK